MGACAALGITNQDALREDLENGLFLNSALQRFTCELYYRFSSFLAPLRVGIIPSRHYLSEHKKMEERVETMKAPQPTSGAKPAEMTKNLLTLSKSKGPGGAPLNRVIGSFIGMSIVVFCFGIGLMLAVKSVNNLEELIRRY